MRVVDLFSGAGGATTGIRDVGGQVVAAVNHSLVAVATHKLNHPDVFHVCQDAGLMDPASLPAFDCLVASPECKTHSYGYTQERPGFGASRSTAWTVIDILHCCRPRFVMVENVPPFCSRWVLYPVWLKALETLGYQVRTGTLDAADFGVPQHRKRFILMGSLGAKPELPDVRLPLVPAREIVELNAGKWSPWAGYVHTTRARILAGRAEHGDLFIAPYYTSGSGLTGRSIDRPVGTITCVDRWQIVRGDLARMFSTHECLLAQGFPADYRLTGNKKQQMKQIGNAYPPAMAGEIFRKLVAA